MIPPSEYQRRRGRLEVAELRLTRALAAIDDPQTPPATRAQTELGIAELRRAVGDRRADLAELPPHDRPGRPAGVDELAERRRRRDVDE